MNQVTRPAASGASVPVAKLPLRQVTDVRTLLMNDQAKQQLATVAASHMKPERMMRLIANAARTTPKLLQCEPMSLLGALMQCASLGLEPNTVLGHAYLIPFDNNRKTRDPETGRDVWTKTTDVQLIVGYKGLIDLARRSGHITSLSANVHYSDDELWEYEEGTESTLRHRPGAQEGQKLHAYAIAKFKDGGHAYVVLPWANVMRIRDGSQGWQSAVKFGKSANSPWAKHEDEMAKKTAIRALAKYLPLSIEFMDAVQVDGAQANYAQFAVQPVEGLQIEHTDDDEATAFNGEHVDSETGEVTQIEDQRATQQTIEPEREREPARRQTRAKAEDKPAARQARNEPAQRGMDLDATPSLSDRIKMLDSSIKEMLAEGAPLTEVLEMFEDQLNGIKADDADEHAAMIEDYEAIAANRA